jgi:xanthosine utilization system XapX-like protein
MKIIYKPFAIILGLLGGLVGRQVFNQVWQRVDDEEPPEPTTRDTKILRLLAAVALQGAIFALVKMVVQRSGAKAWRYFFGIWPGEKRPDPA